MGFNTPISSVIAGNVSFVAAIAMEKAHKWNFAMWKSWTERKERLFPMDPRETT
jgi:hypothetical protein